MSFPSLFEYLSPADAAAIVKLASESAKKPEESSARRIAKTVGTGLLGTGLGYGAGALSSIALDKIYEKATGHRIPPSTLMAAVPVLGAGAGLAYSLYKAHEMEEMRRAIESEHNESGRRVL